MFNQNIISNKFDLNLSTTLSSYFQRLMEGVLRNISNVIVYIDDLLVHTKTHEDHVKVLEQVLQRLIPTTSRSIWRSASSGIRRFPTLDSLSLLKV